MPSQYFLGPRHFGTPFTVHVNSSSKLSSQSSVPSQIWSFSIHFPPNSHLYWSTVQSCAKIGTRRQHIKIVKFKYCRRAMMSLWFTEIKTTMVCWLQIKPVFSPGITQPLLKKFEGSGALASAALGQPPQFILLDHFCVKEAKKLMKLDYIIINSMFAHPNLAWFLRPALLYIHLLSMFVCTKICISWSFGKYEFSGRRLRFVKRLRDFKWKSCARKLNEGAARFPVNNWTPLKHKHAKEQMHSQARAAWGQINPLQRRQLACPLPYGLALLLGWIILAEWAGSAGLEVHTYDFACICWLYSTLYNLGVTELYLSNL